MHPAETPSFIVRLVSLTSAQFPRVLGLFDQHVITANLKFSLSSIDIARHVMLQRFPLHFLIALRLFLAFPNSARLKLRLHVTRLLRKAAFSLTYESRSQVQRAEQNC